jgi:deazaflavin-dependent oxidoreductase (nitroreductase family)
MSEPTEADTAISYSSRGNTRWIILKGDKGRVFDRALVRCTGFSFITWQYAKAGGVRYRSTLLLTTIGKRSGRLRSRALPYYRDEDRFVVVGSNGGGPKDPDWVWNVRANGSAWVNVKRRKIPVNAHVSEGDEYERLFTLLATKGDSLARYQERASTFGRTVPLVVLTPRV